ncbi:hypothetical protein LLG95_03750 [bacterium]|nr:hypothetical protein [bacterium]
MRNLLKGLSFRGKWRKLALIIAVIGLFECGRQAYVFVSTTIELRSYLRTHRITQCPNGHATLSWRPMETWGKFYFRSYEFGVIPRFESWAYISSKTPAYYLECDACGFVYFLDSRQWARESKKNTGFPFPWSGPIAKPPFPATGGEGFAMICTSGTVIREEADIEFQYPSDRWNEVLRPYKDWVTSAGLPIGPTGFERKGNAARFYSNTPKQHVSIKLINKPEGSENFIFVMVVDHQPLVPYSQIEVSKPDYPTYYQVHPIGAAWIELRWKWDKWTTH